MEIGVLGPAGHHAQNHVVAVLSQSQGHVTSPNQNMEVEPVMVAVQSRGLVIRTIVQVFKFSHINLIAIYIYWYHIFCMSVTFFVCRVGTSFK